MSTSIKTQDSEKNCFELEVGTFYRCVEKPDGYGMEPRVFVGKYLETREIEGMFLHIMCRGLAFDRALCNVGKWTFHKLSSLEAELY
jgi:hypothetical protein